MVTEQTDYSSFFRENKGTKTIKVTKDIYESLLYCKGMDLKISMTDTIAKLFCNFQHDCVPKSCVSGEDEPEHIFVLKSIDGRERRIPEFSNERVVIRVAVDLHKALTGIRSHPEESLNMVIFRLICSFYQNKHIYRIFTGYGCGNCKMLIRELKDLMSKNRLVAENIFIEVVDGNAIEFRDIMIAHEVNMLPLSVLYDSEGNEVWSASGFHDINEVNKKLEQVAKYVQPHNDGRHNKRKKK